MRFAIVAVLVLALSGCFGLPEGAADFGDQVSIEYVVLDPDTGAPLAWGLSNVPVTDVNGEPHYNGVALRSQLIARLAEMPSRVSDLFIPTDTGSYEPVHKADFEALVRELGLTMEFSLSKTFELGAGQSGLGFQVERGLVGVQVNDTLSIVSREDATRGFAQTQRIDSVLPGVGGDTIQVFPRGQYESSLGAPVIGYEFRADNIVSRRVVSFDNDTVETEVILDDGQEMARVLGSQVLADVNPLTYQFVIVPIEGEVFTIDPNPQGTPLDLPPGTYRSIGVQDGQAVWAYSSTPEELVEVPIEVMVEVTNIQVGIVTTDSYGERTSPAHPKIESLVGSAHSHDGHDHTH